MSKKILIVLILAFSFLAKAQVIFLSAEIKRQNPVIFYSYKGDKQKVAELLAANPRLATKTVAYDPERGFLESLGNAVLTIFSLGFYDGSSSVTPIEAAVAGGHFEIVKVLLSKGISSERVLRLAIDFDKRKIIDSMLMENKGQAYYLARGAIAKNEAKYLKIAIEDYHLDPNSSGPKGEDPLLMLAVKNTCEPDNKQNNPLNYLLSCKDIDINIKDNYGNTPVMRACITGSNCTRPCSLLINAGADLNVMNKDGYTLLDKTISDRNPKGSEFLISKGAKPSGWEGFRGFERGDKIYRYLEKKNYTALEEMKIDSLPFKFREGTDLAKILAGCIREGDINGLTYMEKFHLSWNGSVSGSGYKCGEKMPYAAYSVCQENIKLLKFLMEHGANVHVKSNDSLNLIQFALKNCYRPAQFIEILAKAGVNINETGKNSEAYVFYIAETNNLGKMQVFLEYGGDPNVTDETGATLLDRISGNRSLKKMKRFLKKHGALTAKQLIKKRKKN